MPSTSADRSTGDGRGAQPPDPVSAAPNGDPILLARFAVPVLPSTFVPRPRLTRRLTEQASRPLVLVNGPAGAGKTLLVADWAAGGSATGPVAWLTVESSDNAPGVFWAYVIESLRHRGVGLAADVVGPADAHEVDVSLLARLAACLHDQDPPVTLVLDEFERVSSPRVAEGLNDLLRHAAPGLRLILISRDEPLLPLHRYRAAGELTAVRAADLAFAPDEAAALFAGHGIPLPEETVAAVTERTGGWAAGLRLSALAAQEATDPVACLREFEAGHSTIADFLTAEVLEAQSAGTQELLLRTCILGQVHPDLADALTGRRDAERILEDLYRANAFVLPLCHRWYRYHPLFAEILRVHLRARHPGLERRLHDAAARWLAGAGRIAEALGHAAAAAEWEFAAELFLDRLEIGRLFVGRDADGLARLFAEMPPTASGPAPELIRAALQLVHHSPERALAHLRRAEEQLPDGAEDETASLLMSAACLRVLAGRALGVTEMAESAAEETTDVGKRLPQELLDRHPELPALVLTDLGSALLWDGRFAEAGRALTAVAEASDGAGTAQLRHESLSRLGLIDLLDGRLGRAETRVRAAAAEAERSGLPRSAGTGAAHLVLAEVAIDRDELPAADSALRLAGTAAAAHPDPLVAQETALARSRLRLAEGDPQGALDAVREAEKAVPDGAGSPWLADRVAVSASAAHLSAGRPEAALAALDDADPLVPEAAVASARARLALGEPREALDTLAAAPPRTVRTSTVNVEALLTRAHAALSLGDEETALRQLGRALANADPERIRLPFRLSGPWLRHLLRASPGLAASRDWLRPGLRSGPTLLGAADAGGPVLVEPLSEREHDVLERAAEMMSTDEIAEDLYLSVNTVKTHLKSINRKLAASRRGEAVRRARELGLL